MTARIWKRLLFIMALLLLPGCGQKQADDGTLALVKTTNPAPIHIQNGDANKPEQIQKDVSSFPEVYDVAVIKNKKETLVVYKVKQLQRFRMKTIEKNITNHLEKKHPKEDFIVSSDYKIFLEAVRLKDDMKKRKISKKEAEKRFKEIVSLTEEMT